ncbi:MAG TPA: tetratricopeptide repeat protein [Thermoanaerobaculia bacterium]|nr:tetratricopeptide repeat protein [Thermoanaerobaculia bacterium]
MNDSAYWDLHSRAVQALHEARLTEAEGTFIAARREAEARGLSSLADRAYCNWAATRIVMGRPADLRDGLSRILGQSADPKARQLASYYLAVIHCNAGSVRPAQFYLEMSKRQAEHLRDRQAQASNSNLLGLLRMQEGRLDLAAECLRESLEISTRAGEYRNALVTMSTLGYCLSLQGSLNEGLWMLEEAQGALTAPDWKVYEPTVRLNLGFSYLEMGDIDESIEQGKAALKSVEGQGFIEEERFAYYLLGEAHAQRKEEGEAKEYFDILQQAFYPQYPGLAESLLEVRTSRWLNWLGR